MMIPLLAFEVKLVFEIGSSPNPLKGKIAGDGQAMGGVKLY